MNHLTIRTLIPLSLIVIFNILFISCGPDANNIASVRYKKAQELFNNKEYNNAKLILDSIIEEQKEVAEYSTKATELLKTIKIQEQKNNIQYLDSMLRAKQTAMEPLMKNFIIEDDYQKKVLTHKRQKTTNSYNRTYLRSHLDLNGNFYISSYFCGASNINHSQIKVSIGDRSINSEVVPFDDFNNRHFDDGGNKWEVVNYKDGKDNGIIDFIAQNMKSSIKVQFIGKGTQSIIMEQFDKEAIADGYEISFILQEIAKLKTDISNAKKELGRIK
jgi:hypothetical protein